MLLHPGKEIATRLESLEITQKAFSQQIGKRVSEINELIKGKRNITLARDYLLSQFFHTEQKYWLQRQIDYDYEQFLLTVASKQEKKSETSSVEVSEKKKELPISNILPQQDQKQVSEKSLQQSLQQFSQKLPEQVLEQKEDLEAQKSIIAREQEKLYHFQEIFIAF